MNLLNVEPIENLRRLFRSKARDYETKTVNPALVDQFVSTGWTIDRKNEQSVRIKRSKSHGLLLEDRVWALFYRMRFTHLSAAGGAQLILDSKSESSPKSQIDEVAIDDEVAIAVECKSSEQFSKRPQFQHELGKFSLIRDRFTHVARGQFTSAAKRQIVLAMFTSNIIFSDNDKNRAKEANIALLDERDLKYYESLVAHIGPAAKYQFLAELLPGKTIAGLEIRVPAIKTKMGGANCYTFSIAPEYLLKISYVSHRAKGKASDVSTYQRMLSKGRLSKIRQYISEDGIFPTNIVVNIDKNRLTFQKSAQEDFTHQENGVAGWLDIRSAYKSAWIIDGQHRLFAYSGHPKTAKSRLAVLAFEGLPASEQARLFIDINAKQKSVKQSLLQELYAELHWDAAEDSVRVRAIVSRAIQDLDVEPDSALKGRIQTADVAKDELRCISLTSLYSAVEKTEFLIAKEKHGHVIQYGPLWASTNEATLKRTVYVLKNWFNAVRDAVPDWWDKGAGEGGGLAMNDGVTTVINVLRSVFQQIDSTKLLHMDDEDLSDYIKKYVAALGKYFAGLDEAERRAFRELRGIQGQTRRTRKCQEAMRKEIPSFNPEGLDKYLLEEKAETNTRGKALVESIEKMLQSAILEELQQEMNDDWWVVGVPKPVRQKVMQRLEEDDGQRGGREFYFDLVDYQKIAMQNWEMLESFMGYGAGGKEKRLKWLDFVNAKRNMLAHASSGKILSIEDLTQLQTYESWLKERLATPEEENKGISVGVS